ncbi:MAG: hypothetical protein HQ526_09930, partial [Actinobacteria bacterium]|nr:hypothetical protein [Actinomycetota bacterium]
DGRRPAPVHLNLAFRDPLVPDSAWKEIANVVDPNSLSELHESAKSQHEPPPVMREPINYIAGDLGLDRIPSRGLVLVGDVPIREISEHAIELATACGWPLVSATAGNAAAGDTFIAGAAIGLADADFLAENRPEVVVSIGRFGLSRPVMNLVRFAEHHVVVQVGGKDRPDPLRTGEVMVDGVPRPPTPDSLVSWEGPASDWLTVWRELARQARTRIDAALDDGLVTGLTVAAEVWGAAGSVDVILAAASRTTGYFEAVAQRREDSPWIIGNRGTSGIDGLISTAYGAALAEGRVPNARTFAVLGDLAFLHDHNGLLAPTDEPCPDLTLVVVDNNGGGIFSSLEQGGGEYQADFERVFGTPPDQDLLAIAAATGWQAHIVATVAELRVALAASARGRHVVIVRAADRAAEQHQWEGLLG